MPARPYVLAETAWPALSDAGVTVAVLPWGTQWLLRIEEMLDETALYPGMDAFRF